MFSSVIFLLPILTLFSFECAPTQPYDRDVEWAQIDDDPFWASLSPLTLPQSIQDDTLPFWLQDDDPEEILPNEEEIIRPPLRPSTPLRVSRRVTQQVDVPGENLPSEEATHPLLRPSTPLRVSRSATQSPVHREVSDLFRTSSSNPFKPARIRPSRSRPRRDPSIHPVPRGRPPLIRSATDEFRCSDCNAGFARNEHLKRHIKSVHEKERPFICSVCSKAFSRTDNLNQHLKTHDT